MNSMTDAQRDYIDTLRATREIPTTGQLACLATHVPVDRAQASRMIDALRKLPTRPEPLLALPAAHYALRGVDGTWRFYEVVKHGNARRYVTRLIGAPGSWHRDRLDYRAQRVVARRIDAVGAEACAIAYAREHGRCSVCDSPLSDAQSIARGIGPVCARRFA